MTKPFIFENIEPKGFTQQGLYLFNAYIHTYINLQTPVRRPCDNVVL